MGVHGLWDLLAPVGRRVSVETIAGKRLAIDASIWMIQFMKAMRDEKGEMVRNAHILGFFRRICKLLYLRTKPVFVFDGGTPALKRRTVIARRRQRENAQAKIRKTAEKLLLNHLKAMRVKEVAKVLDDQKSKNLDKGKKVMLDQDKKSDKNESAPGNLNQEMIDEMLAASLAAEEGGGFINCSATHADISGSFDGSASTSAAAISLEDEDEEDDEEMIFPMTNGNVDPSVLAALPPSMQLDLLVQMRERLMAENRQKYQKVKKAPQKFSELQIEAYLKTVAFRREIDGVQKAAAGKGVGGVQTSRIASEANREFIFSSSFAGDKEAITCGGQVKNSEKQGKAENEHALPDCQSNVTPAVPSNPGTSSSVRTFGDDVQTYLDERGQMRLSRVRALGVHMTRDLQRNLDLMKELELDTMTVNDSRVRASHNDTVAGASGSSRSENRVVETSYECNADSEPCNISNSLSEVENPKDHSSGDIRTALEISIEDDEDPKSVDGYDELFAQLVAQSSLTNSTDNYNLPGNHVVDSASDCEWEDGIVGEEVGGLSNANKSTENLAQVIGSNKDKLEVEWEEGDCDMPNYAAPPPSKGSLEEAAALEEAIRKSLLDIKGGLSDDASYKVVRSEEDDDPTCKVSISQERDDLLRNIASYDSVHDKAVEKSAGSPVTQSTSVPATSNDDASVEVNLVEPGETYEESRKSLTDDINECPDSANTIRTDDSSMVSADLLGHTDADASRSDLESFQTCDFNRVSGATRQKECLLNKPASHPILKGQIGREEVLDRVEEREHGVESPTVDDVDSNLEMLGVGLEDELLILGQENETLEGEQRKLERNADSVNSEMFVECQELLQMFGLPYIIAPMEAEAQCAYMELLNLVDGVVTDDSDVFLFGARSVYKNIFDDRKYVETYFMKDIENELGLDRGKLIRMAMLLGSDYTEGVSGIGVVNAIEVVNAFPEEDGLQKFREWVESPDPSIFGNLGAQSRSSSKKRGPETSGSFLDSSDSGAEESSEQSASQASKDVPDKDNIDNTKQIFMDKHRNVSKNWHLPSSFPSDAVISAYASPQVDKSTEPFTWGKPDHLALRKLCWEKFGWGGQKSDELLLPVLKEYNKHETQLRLEAFYSFNERFAKIRSKRVKQAVRGITANQSVALVDDEDTAKAGPQVSKKRRLGATLKGNRRRKSLAQMNDGDGETSDKSEKEKQTRKKKGQKEVEEGNVGLPTEAKEEGSHDLARGGGGRGRGKRRAARSGRGRRIMNPASEFSDRSTSYTDKSNDEDEQEVQNLKAPRYVRRSMRCKKAAKYAESDPEVDEDHKQPTKEAVEREASNLQTVGGDASADIDMVKPHALDSHGDGLAMGSGLCIDEEGATGASQPGLIQSDSVHVDAERDYLEIGGGFCTEDADMDPCMSDYAGDEARGTDTIFTKPSTSSCETDEVENTTLQTKNMSTAIASRDQEISGGNPSEMERSANEHIKDDDQRSMNALSAMPFLRRKKRRNQ